MSKQIILFYHSINILHPKFDEMWEMMAKVDEKILFIEADLGK